MSKQITISVEDLKQELIKAHKSGQVNKDFMDAGLERDESEDYAHFALIRIQLDNIKNKL